MRPFAPIFVPDDVDEALSDEAWLGAMLDVAQLARAVRAAGNPVEPLARALRDGAA